MVGRRKGKKKHVDTNTEFVTHLAKKLMKTVEKTVTVPPKLNGAKMSLN